MRKFSKKQYLAAGAAAVIVAAGAGTAFAYWTTTGSGSGSATTGTSTAFDVSVGTPVGDALSPAGPTDSVTFTVTNNGSGHQKVNSADVVSVANSNGSVWNTVAGCSASDYSITDVALTATDLAPGGTVNGTFSIQMLNLDSDQNGCKGATVPLYVHVN